MDLNLDIPVKNNLTVVSDTQPSSYQAIPATGRSSVIELDALARGQPMDVSSSNGCLIRPGEVGSC